MWEAILAIAGQEHSRGDMKPLEGFGFALRNFHQRLHILPRLLRLNPGVLKCSWNLAKASAKLARALGLGEGKEGGNGEVSPGFKFQDKTFAASNSFQLQEPCDNIATRNPKYWVCVRDRNCQAEEWDFKAELKNRITSLSVHRMCWKSAGNIFLLITQIWPPFSLVVVVVGKAFEAVEWQLFPPCLWEKGVIWHVARSQAQGCVAPACSWLQLSARSLRTGCSPKVV